MMLTVQRRQLLRRLLFAVGVGAFLLWIQKLLKRRLTPSINLRPSPTQLAAAPEAAKPMSCPIDSGPSPKQLAAALEAAPEAAAKPTSGPKKFAAFLSHCKADAAMEARYLQGEMERGVKDGRSIFLDSDDLRDLTQLQQHVRDSDVLVLLQSANVLSRPYCVLELVTAIEAGVPVLGVTLSSSGYIFSEASALLTHLDEQVRICTSICTSVYVVCTSACILPHVYFRMYTSWTSSAVFTHVVRLPHVIGSSRSSTRAPVRS